MIPGTAIWLLAALALCSPGTVVTHQIRESIGAGYQVWIVEVGEEGVQRSASGPSNRPTAEAAERVLYLPDPAFSAANRLYFGSLFNRPPPAHLS